MQKDTIFFCHSSKDKSLILPIKKKVEKATGNAVTFFMSSDGQSIPFGRNWVSKVEEGLEDAKIMFVFATPQSLSSAWIYFEAGYAYSKNIKVIPVGIGISVDDLKAPLSLLQGFNVESGESLNNIITIINKEFDFSFEPNFSEEDYSPIRELTINRQIVLSEMFSFAQTEINQKQSTEIPGEIIQVNIDQAFQDFLRYLDNNEISYSSTKDKILTSGLSVEILGYDSPSIYEARRLRIKIAMVNFELSLKRMLELFDATNCCKVTYLHFIFSEKYDCLVNDIQISALMDQRHDVEYGVSHVGSFQHTNGLSYGIINPKYTAKENRMYVLSIASGTSNFTLQGITEIMTILLESSVIFKKT